MDFNMKKLVDDAGTFISRAMQITEEKFITGGEKTGLEPTLDRKCKQAEETRNWTQRIIKDTESVLTPNPAYRMEDFLLEKIEKKRPDRMSNTELLGQAMIDAGNEFGIGTAYGSMLAKVGANELKLGQTERDFINHAVTSWITPLSNFMENEVKNYMKERKILENRRLDLDAAKNKLKKARGLSGTPQSKDGTDPKFLIQQAEGEVVVAQKEFNQHAEIVRVQLEVLFVARDRHVEHLRDFVQSQATYYARCSQLMQELNKDLEKMPLHSVNLEASMSVDSSEDVTQLNETPKISLKGKVMYDHVANTDDELSVFANEIISVEECSDTEYFIAYKANSKGKVPKCCILLL